METVLNKIAEIINGNSKKYSATVPEEQERYMSVQGKGEKVWTSCHVITLTTLDEDGKPRMSNRYKRNIYGIDIEKAIKRLARKHRDIQAHIDNGNPTLLDIEHIIREATNGMIKPELAKTAAEIWRESE